MKEQLTANKFIPYFQKKYKMSFHKANIMFTLYEMLCECCPDAELTQDIENSMIKAADELIAHENSPSIEQILLQEKQ